MERRGTRVEVYVHAVWRTWGSEPLITSAVEPQLIRAANAKALELRCKPIAVGGMFDHLHILVGLHASVPVGRLVGEIKGVSSHLLTHRLGMRFRWQAGYAAFSIAPEDVDAVANYVRDQKRHHAHAALLGAFEPCA